MDRQFWKISTLLIAAGYASMYPGCFAQTIAGNATGQPPAKSVEYASAATADGAEKDSAATSPAAVPPAEPAVTTE